MSEACHLGLPNSSDEMIPSGWEEQRGRADSRGSEIKPVCLHLLNTSNVAQPFKDVRRRRKKKLTHPAVLHLPPQQKSSATDTRVQ